jgi:hypothetical protein
MGAMALLKSFGQLTQLKLKAVFVALGVCSQIRLKEYESQSQSCPKQLQLYAG